MSKEFTNLLIQECLTQIRKTKNLVQLTLRINPYLSSTELLNSLRQPLQQQQKMTQKLILSRKIQPPLLTCPVLTSTLIIMRRLISQCNPNDNEQVLLSMQKSQEWANDCIRELNDREIDDKQIKEFLIKFRNTLEQFTQNEKQKYGSNNSRYSRILKFII